ncbi:methyl-accepting chemotaxis protein [Bradyrhizobium sp. CCGUVB1N3]|uniref:methyl-accepting chemotaxis protein n=1 Tax=Bradyrhizobium sp. CCGUVB1N3 TaxID=2949629 RepID=UPI0020B41DCD|nr:methyl-accepting chemotaxis protein [Bradyrhizobium sp. CCGUVB1N3]MCP3471399.1 methyl-accepting chemotaxis protein [Bradyrhizobium sp. CCGUVB1N3]
MDEAMAITAFESIKDGITVYDADRCVLGNDAAAHMLGLSGREELRGLSIASLSLDPQPNGKTVAQMFEETNEVVMRSGHVAIEWWLRRKNHTSIPVRISLVVSAFRGHPIVVCVWQDITDLVRMREERLSLAGKFDNDVSRVVDVVAGSMQDMQAVASEITASTDDVRLRAEAMTGMVKKTEENSTAVSSAAQEFSASISEISRQVSTAANVSQTAREKTVHAEATLSELVASVTRISSVVQMIEGIASQTNLLALNATIEAARAGEAGRGFAVVAGEVKTLAAQAAKATSEVDTQILAIQRKTELATAAMGEIADIVEQVQEISSSISAAVEEQSIVTNDISRSITKVSADMREASRDIDQLNDASRASGSSAGHAVGKMMHLSNNISSLQAQVSDFLIKIRA